MSPSFRTVVGASNFLARTDFEQPALVTIENACLEMIKDQDRGVEVEKLVVHFKELDKGLILNIVNAESITDICNGDEDYDNWTGVVLVLFDDPTIMFGKKRVGGIRIRARRDQAPAAHPVGTPASPTPPVEEQPPPPVSPEDIPF